MFRSRSVERPSLYRAFVKAVEFDDTHVRETASAGRHVEQGVSPQHSRGRKY